MAAFDSTKTSLKDLLDDIVAGKIQLPDFQRGWIWDDEHIRSLLISVARAFPIGAIMLLETGGDVRFQIRGIEGVRLPPGADRLAEKLILDGQQRLTSLAQVLKVIGPVRTRNAKGREVDRNYYFDIDAALASNTLDDTIIGLDADKTLRTNFGRDIVLDLTTREKEFETFHFPCEQILNSDEWEEGLMAFSPDRFARYMDFRRTILGAFRNYQVPVIELKKDTSKEAVCLVFEKVNTGGVPLTIFELMTATYAADGFNLRDDWERRHAALATKPLLRTIEPTDFLQGVSLLHSYQRRSSDLAAGKTGKEVTAVTAKREHVLVLPLAAYQSWADKLISGFSHAERFLRMEGFHNAKFLPYRTQLVPLAAVMVHLGERWFEPQIREKLARWFWCGVLGELYGGAVETRIALDVQGLLAWIDDSSVGEPATIIAAGFQATRLDTLRTRTSAAYRGLYVLLQRQGSRDFFWKARILDLDLDEARIDIHHIFPRDWCRRNSIEPRVFNAIVNKTPISYKANRKIGGQAPSDYLEALREEKQVQISVQEQDDILRSHLITPEYLRSNDFEGFYNARRESLIQLVETAMGKTVSRGETQPPAEDPIEEEPEELAA